MYGFFSVFGEKNTARKKKRHKKKPKQVQVEEHKQVEEQLSDEVDSDNEASMLTHVPEWTKTTPEQALMNTMLSSLEESAQELKASQDALRQASCALKGLKQDIISLSDNFLRMEVMHTKGLTRKEYADEYENVSGGCVLS
jgi:hypothetical protein